MKTKTEKVDAPKKDGTIILSCDCNHPFQETRYGHGKRLHNRSGKGGKAACTVCSRSKTL